MSFKRSTILTSLLVLCSVVSHAKDFTVDGIVYTVLSNRDKTVTTKVGTSSKPGNTATGALVIPSTVSDGSSTYTVVQIGTRGFDGCTGITSVSIPNTVILIGSSAFFGCSSLATLEIPSSVATIDLGAFNNCSGITEITLNEGVTDINTDAFKGCTALESLTLPASLLTIGESAFNGCAAMTKVNGGNGSYTVSDNAFLNCEKLQQVTLSATTIGQNAFKGCSSLTDITFSDNLTAIAAGAFSGCDKLTAVICQGVKPSAIETSSFSATALANVTLTIPANTIEDYIGTNWRLFNSFVSGSRKGKYLMDGGLKYLLVNDNDSRYTAMVVNNNYNLTSVSIPEAVTDPADSQDYKVTTIAPNAFKGVSRLSQFSTDYRSVIETIGESAFESTGLTSFTCPPLLTSLSEGVLRSCKSLKEITLNEQLATISRSALEGCENLASFTMSKMLEEIGPRAFYSCTNLAIITFNENLMSIADSAFMGCGGTWRGGGIETLVFNDELESIGDYAFANCGALTSVKFDHALTTIGKGAFSGCGKLAQVTFYDALETLGDKAFANSGVTDIELPSSLEYLGRETFSGCKLAKVSIGDGLKTISPMTFTGSSIAELDLGNVRTIADSAFYSCNIPTIRIPSSVEKIGHVAFSQEASEVIIEDGVLPLNNSEEAIIFGSRGNIYIGRDFNEKLFNTDRQFTLQSAKLVIGNQVTKIPAKTFYTGSYTLEEITLGSSITEIGDSAFYASKASSIIIPSSVKKIGVDAFNGYYHETLAIGSGLVELEDNAIPRISNWHYNITAQTPPIVKGNLGNALGTLHVQGEQAMQAYKAAANWSDFRNYELLTVAERIDVEGSIDDLYWEPGDTVRLTAKVYPEDVSLPYVFWRSTDPAVASVDHTGLVTFHDPYEEDENYTPPTQPCRIIAETLYADGPVAEFAVEDAPKSGIDIIVSEEEQTDGPVEIFNIQGIKVGTSTTGLAPGLYIKRQGTTSTKILIQ